MVSDCLSPAASLKHSKHHKLTEADNVDTPPARPMSDPTYSQGDEEEVQSRQQEPGMTNGQPSQKRLRVAPVVRHLHAVLVNNSASGGRMTYATQRMMTRVTLVRLTQAKLW